MQQKDIDNNGTIETVYDFSRADIGPHTYELTPREFNIRELPFEVAFIERKYIQVFYQNQLLTDSEITITDKDGFETTYRTDNHGWISGLPIETLCSGFTASYSPDGQNVYRMYYLVEDYEYLTVHFFKVRIPRFYVSAGTDSRLDGSASEGASYPSHPRHGSDE